MLENNTIVKQPRTEDGKFDYNANRPNNDFKAEAKNVVNSAPKVNNNVVENKAPFEEGEPVKFEGQTPLDKSFFKDMGYKGAWADKADEEANESIESKLKNAKFDYNYKDYSIFDNGDNYVVIKDGKKVFESPYNLNEIRKEIDKLNKPSLNDIANEYAFSFIDNKGNPEYIPDIPYYAKKYNLTDDELYELYDIIEKKSNEMAAGFEEEDERHSFGFEED